MLALAKSRWTGPAQCPSQGCVWALRSKWKVPLLARLGPRQREEVEEAFAKGVGGLVGRPAPVLMKAGGRVKEKPERGFAMLTDFVASYAEDEVQVVVKSCCCRIRIELFSGIHSGPDFGIPDQISPKVTVSDTTFLISSLFTLLIA